MPAKKKGKRKYSINIGTGNVWKIVSALLGALLVASIYFGGFGTAGFGEKKSSEEVADSALAFISENLVQPGTPVAVKEVTEEKGLYVITVEIATAAGPQEVVSYATKDGSTLFPYGYNMEGFETAEPAEEGCGDVDPGAVAPSGQPSAPSDPVEEGTVKLDIFVMSQCPYGVLAVDELGPVVERLGDKLDLNIYYIANTVGDGFRSLHGQPEVDENTRQLCAKEYYPEEYLDYILCVNKDYRDAGVIWEGCTDEVGIDADAIKECSEGDEGKALLRENIKVTNDLSIGASPTIFINNEPYGGRRSSDAFVAAICAKESLPGC